MMQELARPGAGAGRLVPACAAPAHCALPADRPPSTP
jgi:hypothetical protein